MNGSNGSGSRGSRGHRNCILEEQHQNRVLKNIHIYSYDTPQRWNRYEYVWASASVSVESPVFRIPVFFPYIKYIYV